MRFDQGHEHPGGARERPAGPTRAHLSLCAPGRERLTAQPTTWPRGPRAFTAIVVTFGTGLMGCERPSAPESASTVPPHRGAAVVPGLELASYSATVRARVSRPDARGPEWRALSRTVAYRISATRHADGTWSVDYVALTDANTPRTPGSPVQLHIPGDGSPAAWRDASGSPVHFDIAATSAPAPDLPGFPLEASASPGTAPSANGGPVLRDGFLDRYVMTQSGQERLRLRLLSVYGGPASASGTEARYERRSPAGTAQAETIDLRRLVPLERTIARNGVVISRETYSYAPAGNGFVLTAIHGELLVGDGGERWLVDEVISDAATTPNK